MTVKVLKVNDGEGQVLLTYKRLAAEKGNERLREAYENKKFSRLQLHRSSEAVSVRQLMKSEYLFLQALYLIPMRKISANMRDRRLSS